MILLIAALVGVGIFVVGYGLGKTRGSDYSKIQKSEYKQMVADRAEDHKEILNLTVSNDQYESALRQISSGRGGDPVILASSALSVVNRTKELN